MVSTHPQITLTVTALLWASCFVACAGDKENKACDQDLEETLKSSGFLPLERGPHDVAERIYEDNSLPSSEGIVVDPLPLSRGLHPTLRFWQDPTTCEAVGGAYAWAPPPAPEPEDPEQSFPIVALPAVGSIGNIRTLLVIGPDEGAREDFDIWYEALETLLATGMVLTDPTREQVEEGLEFVCQGIGQDEAVILVTTGRGSPGEGGALILQGEALSYPRLAIKLGQLCGDAGLRVWVLDAPWSQDIDPYLTGSEPFILWRASDAAHPNAPRIAPGRGGLLSAALGRTVAERARQTCVNKRDVFLQELAWIFRNDGEVSNRMTSLRWDATHTLTDTGAYTPLLSPRTVQQQRVRALTEDLPHQMLHVEGIETGLVCETDIECRLVTSNCEPGPCLAWGCIDGRCAPKPDVGLPCDDGSSCTRQDTCDAIGACSGSPVDCGDGEPCTVDTCFWDIGCVSTERSTGDSCDDLNDCTVQDKCDEDGVCVGEDKDCEDGNPCTLDSCDPDEGCENDVATLPCDDEDPCTHQDYCHDGICSGQTLPCIDGNPCTLDACSPNVGCVFPPMPEGTPCDDGDPCTTQDACSDGTCDGQGLGCDDGIPCTIDLCQAGGCSNLPPPGTCATPAGCVDVGEHPIDEPCLICASTNALEPDYALDGAPCPDDGATCTLDQCDAGVCTHPLSPDACHDANGDCVAKGDQVAPCLECLGGGTTGPADVGDPCDDGDPCTVEGICDAQGICAGSTLPCCNLHTELSCESPTEGNLLEGQTTSLVDSWSCSAGLTLVTSEGIHPFTAPCDGVYSFDLTAPQGALLLVVEASPEDSLEATCEQGICTTYTAKLTNLLMNEGDRVYMVVDGLASSDGTYQIVTNCPDCDAP